MSFQNKELIYYWAQQNIELDVEKIKLQYDVKGFSLPDCSEDQLQSVHQEYIHKKPIDFFTVQSFIKQLNCSPLQLLAFLIAIDEEKVDDFYYKVPEKYVSLIQGPTFKFDAEKIKDLKRIHANVSCIVCTDEDTTYLINSYGKFTLEGSGILTTIPVQKVSLENVLFRVYKDKMDIIVAGRRSMMIYQTYDLNGFEPTFVQVIFMENKHVLLYGKINQSTGEEEDCFCSEFDLDSLNENFMRPVDENKVNDFVVHCCHSNYRCQSSKLTLWNKRIDKLTTESKVYEYDHLLLEDKNISAVFGHENTIVKAYNDGQLFINDKKIMDVPKNIVSLICLNLK